MIKSLEVLPGKNQGGIFSCGKTDSDEHQLRISLSWVKIFQCFHSATAELLICKYEKICQNDLQKAFILVLFFFARCLFLKMHYFKRFVESQILIL